MAGTTSIMNLNTYNVKTKAIVVSFLGATFLYLLAILHFLEPEFDPTWRLISEYELGKFGWIMRLAFFCWGGGFLFLTISLWNTLETRGGNIGKWWLLIISIALFGAGIFAPQPITDEVRGTIDKVHSVCGAIMIFTLPFASTIIAVHLSKQHRKMGSQQKFFWVTLFVWVGMIVFLYSMVFYSKQAKTRAYGPDVLIGLPNRFMVLTYTVWLIAVARLLALRNKT
jgi:hypothetical protein